MPKKPNYSFERTERDRAKALKAAEKAEIKREQRDRQRAEPEAAGSDGVGDPPAEG